MIFSGGVGGFAQIDVQNKGLCAAGTFAQKPMPKRWFAV
jgi:hypothetical protein